MKSFDSIKNKITREQYQDDKFFVFSFTVAYLRIDLDTLEAFYGCREFMGEEKLKVIRQNADSWIIDPKTKNDAEFLNKEIQSKAKELEESYQKRKRNK